MELALIISLIALAVALPGCIADSLTVIAKIHAQFKKMKRGGLARPSNRFKKEATARNFVAVSHLIEVAAQNLPKKVYLPSIAFAIVFFASVSLPVQTVLAPSGWLQFRPEPTVYGIDYEAITPSSHITSGGFDRGALADIDFK